MRTIEKILADNLKSWRAKRGFSQSDLAEKAKKSLSAVAQIETCKIWPAPDTVRALAQALAVPESLLFMDTEQQVQMQTNADAARIYREAQRAGKSTIDSLSALPHALQDQLRDYIHSVVEHAQAGAGDSMDRHVAALRRIEGGLRAGKEPWKEEVRRKLESLLKFVEEKREIDVYPESGPVSKPARAPKSSVPRRRKTGST